MRELIVCLLIVIALLLIFAVWGEALCVLFKIRVALSEALVLGMLGVMTAFQAVYLPIALSLRPFHVLRAASLAVLGALTLAAVLVFLFRGSRLESDGRERFFARITRRDMWPALAAFAVLIIFLLVFTAFRPYQGWDTSYYVGSMNEALKTDTIYQFNGDTGMRESVLAPRYALSGFFMFYTVIASVCRIRPLLIAYYVVRPLGVILALLVIYRFGRTLFGRSERAALLLTGLFAVIQFAWVSIYKSSFFIERMYEAKGWCAYVLLPFTALALYRLFLKRGRGRREWFALALAALAAIPVSMSSLMLYPAAVFIGGAAMLPWCEDRAAVIRRCLLLMVPNIITALVYVLMSKGVFTINL